MKLDATDIHELKPVIAEIVRAVLGELRADPNAGGRQLEHDGPNGQTPKLLLTPKEAAAALGVSTSTLATITKRGDLRAVSTGWLVRYSIDDLRDWIARNPFDPSQPRKRSRKPTNGAASSPIGTADPAGETAKTIKMERGRRTAIA